MTLRSRGFTLIELLIVLAIMAGAAVWFATYIRSGSTGVELRAATREMAAALNETRSRAIASNRIASVVIAPRQRRYRDPAREHVLGSRVSIAVQDAVLLDEDGSSDAIYFFPDGSSSGGEVVFAAGAAREAVTIDWFTGHAATQAIFTPR
jgi:general secretion pathway protein H